MSDKTSDKRYKITLTENQLALVGTAVEGMMNDLISRQAAIDALDVLCQEHRYKIPGKVETYSQYNEAWQDALDRAEGAIGNLPSAQPEQRWIPCSERLPEEKDAGILKKLGTNKRSDYVIATVEVKGERMTVTACTYDGVWDWNMKYAFPEYEIVAWMPLPEPYMGTRSDTSDRRKD